MKTARRFRMIRALAALLLAASLYGCSGGASNEPAAGSVNGETVTAAELGYFKTRLRADVIRYFTQDYAADVNAPDFWQTPFGGQTPEKELESRAFDACVRAKIQMVLMREKGIYGDITYQGLYDKAVDFNNRNASGSSAPGLQTIRLSNFYTYYIDTGVMELKKALAENEIKPSAADIAARADVLTAANPGFARAELENLARAALIDEAYEDYIDRLVESARIEKS